MIYRSCRAIFALAGWAVISFLSALLVAGLIYLLGSWPSDMKSSLADEGSVGDLVMNFVGIVLVAPFIETAMLFGLFKFLSPLCEDRRFAAFLSVLLIASLHAIKWWGVAAVVFVPFLIFVHPFTRKTESGWSAFRKSMGMHSIHNFYAFFLTLAADFM